MVTTTQETQIGYGISRTNGNLYVQLDGNTPPELKRDVAYRIMSYLEGRMEFLKAINPDLANLSFEVEPLYQNGEVLSIIGYDPDEVHIELKVRPAKSGNELEIELVTVPDDIDRNEFMDNLEKQLFHQS